MIKGYIERTEGPASTSEMLRGLAYEMEHAWEKNAPKLQPNSSRC